MKINSTVKFTKTVSKHPIVSYKFVITAYPFEIKITPLKITFKNKITP